jgi:hypothetical protein
MLDIVMIVSLFILTALMAGLLGWAGKAAEEGSGKR